MKARGFLFCLAIFTIAAGSPAQAGSDSKTINLDTYIQASFDHSPDAAGIAADTIKMEADAVEASQWRNPEVQVDATAIERKSAREISVEVEQPLRGSDFGARRGFSRAIRAAKNSEQKVRLLELSHNAIRAYADLWQVQANIRLLDSVVKDAKRQTKLVEDAAAQGTADIGEAQIFTAEATELELKRRLLAAQRKAMLNGFVRLAGLPFKDYDLEKPSHPIPDDPEKVLALAENASSIRAILRGRKSIAEQKLSVARADSAMPDLAPRAVLNHDFEGGGSSLTVGVRMAVPVWSRNEAEIMRARADVQSTTQALQALDNNNFKEVLRTAWQAGQDHNYITSQYAKSLIPKWRSVQSLTEKKLSIGQATVFSLWQVRNRLLEAQIQSIETQRSAVEAALTLENLTGTAFVALAAKGERP